ncbi:MAG: GLPGLI family protein [Chitinophagaceae bacterium]|nr:MAG: GLPGLI family protein [Chitinophagaceae bacterium]
MLKIFCLLTICCISNILYSQEQLTHITYKLLFNRKYDQGGSDIRSYTGSLEISNSVRSNFYMVADSQMQSTENTLELDPDTIWRVRADLAEQAMLFNDIFNEKLLSKWYRDTLYPMEWTIDNETKVIDSLSCTRATADFRGRTYIAWFCSDLALPFGPWKIGGLPGLIIRLEDEHGYLKASMVKLSRSSGVLSLPIVRAQSFDEFVRSVNATRRTMKQAMRTTNCVDCESQVKFHSWEKVFSE